MSEAAGEVFGLPRGTLEVTSTSFDVNLTMMLGVDASRFRPGIRVLDLGAGASNMTQVLNDEYGVHCIAIDPAYNDKAAFRVENDRYLVKATTDYAGTELYETSVVGRLGFENDLTNNPGRYVAADARQLPFADGSIDLILSSVFLSSKAGEYQQFVNDVMCEAMRVLRKGGSFHIGPIITETGYNGRVVEANIIRGVDAAVKAFPRSRIKAARRIISQHGKAIEVSKR